MDREVQDATSTGLTSAEARRRLVEFGPNAVAEKALPNWRIFLAKFWGPVPWMLEIAIFLQLFLSEYVEAAVVGGLLLFNATLGFVQEGRAGATLAALKKRLFSPRPLRRPAGWGGGGERYDMNSFSRPSILASVFCRPR